MAIGRLSGVHRQPVTIPSGDVKLAAEAFGCADGVPVVLLPGGGQTRHTWASTATDLAASGWFALTVDLRGHGESGWSPSASYGMDDFAGDVVSVVDHLGRPAVLVGASLGGLSALAAAGRSPQLATGLVLVDVSPFVQPQGADRIRGFMTARPDGFETLEDVADAVAAYLPHRPRPHSLDGLRKNLRRSAGRWFWHWDPTFLRTTVDQPIHRNSLIDPVRLGAASSSLRVPTLLVRGGRSDVLSLADVRQFLRLVLHAEYAVVAGAHHMVAGDDNSAFGRVLNDFLERRVVPRLAVLAEHDEEEAPDLDR